MTAPRRESRRHLPIQKMTPARLHRLFTQPITDCCGSSSLKIDLCGALSMLSRSWADVTQATIRNCFRHAGLLVPGDDPENPDECSNEDIAGVAQVSSALSEFPDAVDTSTVDEFVSVDDGVATTGELENADCIAYIVRSTSQHIEENQRRFFAHLL